VHGSNWFRWLRYAGWWFGTWILFFHNIWDNPKPIDFHIFQDGQMFEDKVYQYIMCLHTTWRIIALSQWLVARVRSYTSDNPLGGPAITRVEPLDHLRFVGWSSSRRVLFFGWRLFIGFLGGWLVGWVYWSPKFGDYMRLSSLSMIYLAMNVSRFCWMCPRLS
jgi:hypothetical protein